MAEDRGEQSRHPSVEAENIPAAQLHMDEARYLPMIESLDVPEEQARELLRMIWNVLVIAADLGVGLDPVQILLNVPLENSTKADENTLQYSSLRKTTFKNAASRRETR